MTPKSGDEKVSKAVLPVNEDLFYGETSSCKSMILTLFQPCFFWLHFSYLKSLLDLRISRTGATDLNTIPTFQSHFNVQVPDSLPVLDLPSAHTLMNQRTQSPPGVREPDNPLYFLCSPAMTTLDLYPHHNMRLLYFFCCPAITKQICILDTYKRFQPWYTFYWQVQFHSCLDSHKMVLNFAFVTV